MLGVLPADRVQRPHRHQSVALDLITDCAPGCYTLVGRDARRTGPRSSTRSGSSGRAPAPSSPHPASGTAITTSRAVRPTWSPSRTPASTPTCARSTSGSHRRTREPGGVRQRPLPPPRHQPGHRRGRRGRARGGRRSARPGGGHRHPSPRRGARGRGGRHRRPPPPAGPDRLRGRVGGRPGRRGRGAARHQPLGRPGRPAAHRRAVGHPTGRRLVGASHGWPDDVGFAPSAALVLADPFTFPAADLCADLADAHPGLPVVGGYASGRGGPGRHPPGPRRRGRRRRGRGRPARAGHRGRAGGVAGLPALRPDADGHPGGAEPGPGDRRPAGHGVHGRRDRRAPRPGRHRRHRGQRPPARSLRRRRRPRSRARATSSSGRSSGWSGPPGALSVEDRVPLGDTVQFAVRDAGTAAVDLDHRRWPAAGPMPRSLFTCNGRGTRLFDDRPPRRPRPRPVHSGPVPLGGMFAAGEFGPVGGVNFVHTFAASAAAVPGAQRPAVGLPLP